eukprot:EG_transcript_25981
MVGAVIPNLFLGSKWEAADREWLRAAGVTHIVNAAREVEDCFPGDFVYHRCDLVDDPEEELRLEPVHRFVADSLAAGGVVLVHCQAGVSRSAAVAIGYLMAHCGATLRAAYLRVKECRPNAGPNIGYMRQLEALDQRLHGAASFTHAEYFADQLAAMGFPAAAIARAVPQCNGRLEVAVSLCLAAAAGHHCDA